MSMVVVRRGVPGDADAIVGVHVRAWQWTYRGQIPDSYLDDLSNHLPEREAWRREILGREGDGRTWVAEVDGVIVGFADTGPSRDADRGPLVAELYSIHVEPAATRRGVGRALLTRAIGDLRGRGYREVTLWVLVTNERARRFYAALGWSPDGTAKIEARAGFDLHEVRYELSLASSAQTSV